MKVELKAIGESLAECMLKVGNLLDKEKNPVEDYLLSLKWDGVPRVRSWMQYYLGAADAPYERGVGRMMLIGAVARALVPGCRSGHTVILEGPAGIGKSCVLRILAGEWYCGPVDAVSITGKQLAGNWIVEICGMSFPEELTVRSVDCYRESYGRELRAHKRACIFVGTTTHSDYIEDSTGGRRFWPVKVGDIDLDLLKEDRDQIWAEAVEIYQSGGVTDVPEPVREERTKYWGLYDTVDHTWQCDNEWQWEAKPTHRFRYESEEAAESEKRKEHYIHGIVPKPFYVRHKK